MEKRGNTENSQNFFVWLCSFTGRVWPTSGVDPHQFPVIPGDYS